MQQHVKVLEFQLGYNNNKRAHGEPPKKKLPYQYKNPKTKELPKQDPLPKPLPAQKKLITQDDYENVPKKRITAKDKQQSDSSPMKSNPLANSTMDDPKVINTINLIANNPNKFKCTNKILREIGQIANSKNVAFLSQQTNDNIDPSSKLSNYLGGKLMEENKAKMMPNGEDQDFYYNNLVSYIKSEIKKKGTFDYSKLSDKDRKLLAQKKLYDRMDSKYSNDIKPSDNIVNDKDKGKKNDDFVFKKKYFSKENVPYDNYSEGEKEEDANDDDIEDKNDNEFKVKEKSEKNTNEDKGKVKEKLTARQILENIHFKIVLDNERLVNEMEAKKYKKLYKKK